MNKNFRIAAVTVLAVLSAPAAASAQWYGSPYQQPAPLYPYAVQPQGYVVPYAPPQAYPQIMQVPQAYGPRKKWRGKRSEPAPAEESHKVRYDKKKVVNKTVVVSGEPIIVEKKKYVDDPPRVIERHHFIDDAEPAPARSRKRGLIKAEEDLPPPPAPHEHADPLPPKGRVIHAEAEVTILGPDRMNIRLYRKRSGHDANAKAKAN